MKRNLYGIKDVVTQDIHSISMFSSDLEMLRNYRAILEKNKNDGKIVKLLSIVPRK